MTTTPPEKAAPPAKAASAPAPAPQATQAASPPPPPPRPLCDTQHHPRCTRRARQTAANAGTAAAPVRMKVTGGHASLSYGGLTIGTEFTTVPAHMVAAMTEAAADAGVEITQES